MWLLVKQDTNFREFGAVIGLLLSFLLAASVLAEDPSIGVTNRSPQAAPAGTIDPTTDADGSLPEQIQNSWKAVVDALAVRDSSAIHQQVAALNKLRIEAGFESLEDFSLSLIAAAKENLQRGDKSLAALLLRESFELSPASPCVMLASAILAGKTGVASTGSQLFRALRVSWYHPALVVKGLKSAIYPLLWSLTLALYLTLGLMIALRMRELFREIARRLPLGLRPVGTPLIVAMLLIGPCFLGPLWCLFVWGSLLLLTISGMRWLVFSTGALLLLWGSAVPLRESLALWLDDPRIEALLQVAAGGYAPADAALLANLKAARPGDGTVQYTYGQLARRLGNYEQSEAALGQAEAIFGDQPYTKAQRGLVAFSRGDYSGADLLFADAEKLGLGSTEFFFDYSKIKLELLDVSGSQAYYQKGRDKDAVMTDILQRREDVLESEDKKLVAELRLPLNLILSSATEPQDGVKQRADLVASAMMPGVPLGGLLILGTLLLLASLRVADTKPIRGVGYFEKYQTSRIVTNAIRITPGGAGVILGRPLWTVGVLSVSIFLTMPLVRWPLESTVLLDAVPEFLNYYLLIVIGFVAMAALLSLFVSSRGEN